MTIEQRLKAFSQLGAELKKVSAAIAGTALEPETASAKAFLQTALDAPNNNPWHTQSNVQLAIEGLSAMLTEEKLQRWIGPYRKLEAEKPGRQKKVAVIMAGNIPLVGFHDFLCVLISGHHFLGKLSSQDTRLPVSLAEMLKDIEPAFAERVAFSEGTISDLDAVIATGSNNSARYFDHYFGKYPHIIRKNRNSVAVLEGNESHGELEKLGEDVFSYFGLGCRNVSKIMVPRGFSPEKLQQAWQKFRSVTDHHKFFNNYDYFKAVYLVNKTAVTDTGFCLLKPDPELSSPVSVIHYEEYPFGEWLEQYLVRHQERIQCVVGRPQKKGTERVPFGESQKPELWDYADGVDTMDFLLNL